MNPFKDKVAEEVRGSWQARALAESKDKMQRVMLVAIAKEYPAALPTLLRVLGVEDITRPFLCGYAAIMPNGRVICDMIDRDGSKRKVAIYQSEEALLYDMRKLADDLKLSDKDRSEMFAVLQKWVASDQRVGVHGQRLAS